MNRFIPYIVFAFVLGATVYLSYLCALEEKQRGIERTRAVAAEVGRRMYQDGYYAGLKKFDDKFQWAVEERCANSGWKGRNTIE